MINDIFYSDNGVILVRPPDNVVDNAYGFILAPRLYVFRTS